MSPSALTWDRRRATGDAGVFGDQVDDDRGGGGTLSGGAVGSAAAAAQPIGAGGQRVGAALVTVAGSWAHTVAASAFSRFSRACASG